MGISQRKKDHIRICMKEDVRFQSKTSGFEAYDFIHCALPEMDLADVDVRTTFLGKPLSFPFMVSAMTGGFKEAEAINRDLAEVCRETGIAMGLGSQRQILENNLYLESFRIARKMHPRGVLVGNIGAVQAAQLKDPSPFQRMVDLIEADALAVHLNPLQEALQPEGEARFRGVLDGIERLVKNLKIPVIAKEVGCGISRETVFKLKNIGIQIIDIAGAGGTSWAAVESFRNRSNPLTGRFRDWGIPTAKALEDLRGIKGIQLIASGGILDGFTLAKALALGADLCGSALPILKKLLKDKKEGVIPFIQSWKKELEIILFLTGCRNLKEFREKEIILKNK